MLLLKFEIGRYSTYFVKKYRKQFGTVRYSYKIH